MPFIQRILTIEANGLLFLAYAFLDHVDLLLVIGSGMLMLFVFDMAAVRLSAASVSRSASRAAPQHESGWGVRGFTIATLAFSIAAAFAYAEPIPFLQAVVWGASVLALWLLPQEREPLLWRIKGTLLLYALVLLGFRVYLAQVQEVAPEDWAALIGSVGTARTSLANARDLFTTIGMWATWFILPVAHLSYLVQRVFVHPMSLFHARRSAEEIVRVLRRRE